MNTSAGNLRVFHAHWLEDRGGEVVIWCEDQRLYPGHSWAANHPFAPTAAQMRAGLGKHLAELVAVGPAHPQMEATAEGDRNPKLSTHDNFRRLSLSLPTSNNIPLPSPALARASGKVFLGSAKLRDYHLQGLAVGPVSAYKLAQGIKASKANLAVAESLEFFADLAALVFRLTRAGALAPSSRGWVVRHEVAEQILSKLTAPPVVSAQYPGLSNLGERMLGGYARQFALAALNDSEQFQDWRANPSDSLGEFLEALTGRYRFAAPSTTNNQLLKAYQRQAPRAPTLPAGSPDAIDNWLGDLAPSAEKIQTLPQLRLRLQTPETGDAWPLAIDLLEEDEIMESALVAAVIADISGILPEFGFLIEEVPTVVQLTPALVIEVVETREQLAAHGFELDIPPELEEFTASKSRAVVSSENNSSGLLGVDSLCSYHFEVGVGEDWLSEGELRDLAASKAPLVRVRGRWRRLERSAVARAVALISAGEQQTDVFGAMRLAQQLEDEEAETLTVEPPRISESLLTLLAGGLAGEIQAAPAPSGFKGVMRDYQRFGLSWMSFLEERGFGACLADDMGLGKTIQCLALLEAERENALVDHGPTLLIVPFSAVSNWEEEAEKFCPQLRFHIHHGSDRHNSDLAAVLADVDVCLTSYQLLVRDLKQLQAISWHRLVLDEVQKIKNDTTLVARAVFSLQSPRRLALSGTPVENRLSELWSIMRFLNPGLLGSRALFGSQFSTPIEKEEDEEAGSRLRALVAPFILRRTKLDPEIRKQLPAKFERTRPCPLSADQAALYQAVVEDMLAQIQNAAPAQRRGLVFKVITQLKQVCNHPLNFAEDGKGIPGRSGKLAELERICEDALAVDEKTLCFTQYPSFARLLAPYLGQRLGCGVEVFDGTLNDKARQELRHRFQSDPELGLLLISYGAGGTVLNLVAANHVVLYDRWWNPAVEDQASDRAYRIGQTKDVYVHRLVSAGTLEERIEVMLESKRALANLVISSLGAEVTALDNQALRELLSLSTRALSESWGEDDEES